jgi:hypothetical protein
MAERRIAGPSVQTPSCSADLLLLGLGWLSTKLSRGWLTAHLCEKYVCGLQVVPLCRSSPN